MRTTIRDRDALAAFRPVDLIFYLRSAGWTPSTKVGQSIIWIKGADGSNEEDVSVPLRRDAGDFAMRVAEVLSTLERIEQRSQEEIVRDVFSTSADLVRIRALIPESADGSIPLHAGVGMVEHARDLMAAAACAAAGPRSFWPRRRPPQALDFMSRVRMGQTERGSYVLTMLSPVTPALNHEREAESPFERQVTETLTRSLRAAVHAAQQAAETADLEPFRNAVSSGVSANLCDAMAGLGEVSPDHGFEVSVSWSRTRPVPGTAVSRILVPADYLPLLQEASRNFKETATREEFVLLGPVVKLDRAPEAPSGVVTVNAVVDDRARRVVLELAGPDYQAAIQAHKDHLPIACIGELAKEGKSFRLRYPREFEVLGVDDGALPGRELRDLLAG